MGVVMPLLHQFCSMSLRIILSRASKLGSLHGHSFPVVTNDHNLGGSKQQNLLPHIVGGQEFKIKVSEGHACSGGSRGELGLCFFWLLVAAGKPWLTAPSLQSASLVTWSPLCSMSSLSIVSNLCFMRICRSSRWLSGKEPTCKCRRHGFPPWVRKVPWRRSWQPTLVCLPMKSHGQRSLVGYSQWGLKELDTI